MNPEEWALWEWLQPSPVSYDNSVPLVWLTFRSNRPDNDMGLLNDSVNIKQYHLNQYMCIYFLEWKFPMEWIFSYRFKDHKTTLVYVMAWCWTEDMQLHGPPKTKSIDTYIHHQFSLCQLFCSTTHIPAIYIYIYIYIYTYVCVCQKHCHEWTPLGSLNSKYVDYCF